MKLLIRIIIAKIFHYFRLVPFLTLNILFQTQSDLLQFLLSIVILFICLQYSPISRECSPILPSVMNGLKHSNHFFWP